MAMESVSGTSPGDRKGKTMKHASGLLACALVLVCAAGLLPASGQMASPQPPSSVSYLSQGRYLVFQGNYVNDQGEPESGLVKFDSQTGMAWMLRPAPQTNGSPLEFKWMPVKN
jgi:hypothetical protein